MEKDPIGENPQEREIYERMQAVGYAASRCMEVAIAIFLLDWIGMELGFWDRMLTRNLVEYGVARWIGFCLLICLYGLFLWQGTRLAKQGVLDQRHKLVQEKLKKFRKGK